MRIVLGNSSLAKYPQGGGHWMVFLQYLLGLRGLGHEVFLWEQMESTGDSAADRTFADSFFHRLAEFGFEKNAALLVYDKSSDPITLQAVRPLGCSELQLREIAASADLLWNLCGALRNPMLSLFKRRALIDLDPGHLHVSATMCDMGLADHDVFLTIGAKINDADCGVPRLGLSWRTFVPFVYLPMWTSQPDPGKAAPFTSITHWNWEELYHDDRPLSLSKRDAYLRFLDLPHRSGRAFQLAANIHPDDNTGDRELLAGHGWQLTHPYDVADSPAAYQHFIVGSRAEISCVKPIFRELRTGWFSDRSACYLAAGRPVLGEDTGFGDHLPTGDGLILFRDMDEAVSAVADIDANYERHSRSARDFAEQFLDSERSLKLMIDACGG